jgi:Mrp family chromosome partitioning ATPase
MGTRWGELDYLIVDFPPGTGDVNLSLLQAMSVSGNITVTTPNELSFVDVSKGIQLMKEMKVATVDDGL